MSILSSGRAYVFWVLNSSSLTEATWSIIHVFKKKKKKVHSIDLLINVSWTSLYFKFFFGYLPHDVSWGQVSFTAPCWSWSYNSLATWNEEPTHWNRPWCWERLKAEGEEGDREWDGWMASPKHWTWTWANSGRWWGARKPGMLQSMGSGRVRYDWGNEQQILACQWPLCLNFLTHLCEFFESLRSSKIFGRLWRIIFSSQTQLHDPFPSNGLRLF